MSIENSLGELNLDPAKEKQKQKDHNYYVKHKEAHNARSKNYYEINREAIRQQRKEYRAANPEKLREQKKKQTADPFFRLAMNLRKRCRYAIGTGKKNSEYLGADIKHVRRWFEFNFEIDSHLEMRWSNYGILWEIDHVIPVASFREKQDELHKCFHWTNIAPKLANENKRKSSSIRPIELIRQELRLKLFHKVLATASPNGEQQQV